MIDSIGARIRIARENIGLSQVALADKINVSKQTLYKYENGIITNIPSDKIELIAEIVNVSPSYLMGWDYANRETRETKKSKGIKIPVLGRVAAGLPLEAVEEIINWEEISEDMAKTGEFFGLKIKGDSMEPRIHEGDVVIVKQQEDAESGDLVIALVNGHDATCKRLKKYTEGLMLLANNPAYEPQVYNAEQVKEMPVKIIGKVVELRAKF